MNDLEKYLTRAQRLRAIAEEDDMFLMWKQIYEKNEKSFIRFTRWMPNRIRKMLWGYAECGRLMYQRLYSIACENMDFTGERICLWEKNAKTE